MVEALDMEGKDTFDKQLEAEPRAKSDGPLQGMDPSVLAVMAAARMPQQASAFSSSPSSDWKPGDKT